MAAAIAAAENPEVQVLLFERQTRVGRKLQATGNGRCNLSNLQADVTKYHGEDPEFVLPAFNAFSPSKTLEWFRNLGLFTVVEESGKVYPYSDQANSVVDVLRFALTLPNIRVLTGYEVQKIRKDGDDFYISNGEDSFCCNKLIVACGGLAGSKLGGTMSGYKLLGKLGHKSTRLRPSLVQLKSDWQGLPALKGVRTNCCAEIRFNNKLFACSSGELQFTDYGLSGPVIFEISRDVCHSSGHWTCCLDFLPQYSDSDLMQAFKNRQGTALPAEELLTGILHNRLGRVLIKEAGIRSNRPISDLTAEDFAQVCRVVKEFEITLTEPMGMDSAQVTAGGIYTQQFNPLTMESRLVPGLYACGEVLDIDGDCGGFNLQWAWSSGYLAGTHAGKDIQ